MKATWKKRMLTAASVCAMMFAIPIASEAVSVSNTTYGTVDAGSFNRTFSVSGASTIADVDITIDFSKCDDPAPGPLDVHCIAGGNAYANEIVFQLTSPGSTTVNIISAGTYASGNSGDRVTVHFDDEAATTVGGATLLSGDFRPVGLLSAFDGQDPNGTWTLRVADTTGADPLQFYSATLNISTGSPVPEPSTYVMLLSGLGAMVTYVRRRRA